MACPMRAKYITDHGRSTAGTETPIIQTGTRAFTITRCTCRRLSNVSGTPRLPEQTLPVGGIENQAKRHKQILTFSTSALFPKDSARLTDISNRPLVKEKT